MERAQPFRAKRTYIYRPQYRDECNLRAHRPLSSEDRSLPIASCGLVFARAVEEIDRLRACAVATGKQAGRRPRGAPAGLWVRSTDRKGQTVGLLANLLADMQVSALVPGATIPGSLISVNTASLDTAYPCCVATLASGRCRRPGGVFSQDRRRLLVGQNVAILGTSSVSARCRPGLRSVEHRSSGVIFGARSVVKEGTIDLAISHPLSNFEDHNRRSRSR